MIKLLVLHTGLVLVSKIDEVGGDIGEPDCRLDDPYVVGENDTLTPWLVEYTTESVFKMHSDKILTITEASKPTLLEKYQNVTK